MSTIAGAAVATNSVTKQWYCITTLKRPEVELVEEQWLNEDAQHFMITFPERKVVLNEII